MTKAQRVQVYSSSFKEMRGSLTQGVTSYKILGLSCGHCTSCLSRELNSGYALGIEEVITLSILCIMLKQSLAISPTPFLIGVYKHTENNRKFSIHSIILPVLFCVTVFFFYISALCLTFYLPDVSNPHACTLERENPAEARSQQDGHWIGGT